MTYNLLITGFDPFATNSVNPSFQVAQTLANRNDIPNVNIYAHEIPTKWDVSFNILEQKLSEKPFDGLIMIGLAAKRPIISLEKFAHNLDDSSIPDNAGIYRHHQIIDATALETLQTNLPIEILYTELLNEGFPVELSYSAGNFICNHLYFHALKTQKEPYPKDILFVHIPPSDEMKLNNPNYLNSLAFDRIINFFTALIHKITNL